MNIKLPSWLRSSLLSLALLLTIGASYASAAPCSNTAVGPINCIQSAHGNGTNQTTPTMAFGSNLTSGSIIVGAIGWSSATTLNSITASSGCTGLSVTLVDNPTQATFLTAGFYITGYAAGACTLQFNFSASNGEVSYGAHEVSGQATSTPVGTRHKAISFSNAGPSAVETTASVTTSGTDYQFIGYTELSNNQVASAAGSGYTIRESFTGGGGGSIVTADKSTSGTVTGSFTTAASTANYGSVVLIDVAAAAAAAGCTDSHMLGVWRCDEASR